MPRAPPCQVSMIVLKRFPPTDTPACLQCSLIHSSKTTAPSPGQRVPARTAAVTGSGAWLPMLSTRARLLLGWAAQSMAVRPDMGPHLNDKSLFEAGLSYPALFPAWHQ